MTENQNYSNKLGEVFVVLGGCVFFLLIYLTYLWLIFRFIWWAFNVSIWLGIAIIILFLIVRALIPDDKKPEEEDQIPEDAKEILENVAKGEIKDPVTQEIFKPGEKVYLCDIHLFAYHEDSWDEVGCKCMECGNDDNTKEYTVPKLNEKQLTATEST